MNQFDLKTKFTEEFFEEFQYDAEFRTIFESMTRGLTPYEAIEHLCKSKKEILQSLKEVIENTPRKIIVTTERFEEVKNMNMDDVIFECETCGGDNTELGFCPKCDTQAYSY